MPKPVLTQRQSARERLRWQRAMDERLIDSIFGRVIRDVPLPAACLTQHDEAAPAATARA